MLRTEDFINEKKFLENVSPRTLEWYANAFKWLGRYCADEPTQESLNRMVVGMRAARLKPITCNSNIRVFKTYPRWAGLPLKLAYLKTEQKEVQVFKQEDIRKLISFPARTSNDKRAKLLCMLLLDTGLRLEEGLGLRSSQVDMDNLLIRVVGKGNKERVVPFSYELRKSLYVFTRKLNFDFVFHTRHGTRHSRRNALRDFRTLCKHAGVKPPPRAIHALRHTFAVNYLRNGGNLFYLSRILGHTTTRTTEVYLRAIQAEDLGRVHQRLSVLANA